MSGKTMDSLVWLSMWLADRGMERERESIHKLHACLLAVGLDAEPHDLEPRPEEAGACLLPAQKPDMAGLGCGHRWSIVGMPCATSYVDGRG